MQRPYRNRPDRYAERGGLMLPDVGAGTPMTGLWFIATIFLFGVTILSIIVGTLFSRALSKRDQADEGRDKRLGALDEAIRAQELGSLQRDREHQEKIFEIQKQILQCQKELCGRAVSRDEHMGDILRLDGQFREAMLRLEARGQEVVDRVEAMVTRVHARVDAACGTTGSGG